jgi:hypothetical protein
MRNSLGFVAELLVIVDFAFANIASFVDYLSELLILLQLFFSHA